MFRIYCRTAEGWQLRGGAWHPVDAELIADRLHAAGEQVILVKGRLIGGAQ